MQKTVSIVVSGKVQGVFFRQSTKEKAAALNLVGEVKNMPDDTVHILATGTAEQIQQLVEWCRQGPPRARVTGVAVEEKPVQPFYKFSIVR